MNKFKRIAALSAALSMTVTAFSGCTEKEADDMSGTTANAAAETTAATEQKEELRVIYDEIKTEFGTVDLSDYPLTASEVPADYEAVYEAENAEMIGSAAAYANDSASGGSAVNGVGQPCVYCKRRIHRVL